MTTAELVIDDPYTLQEAARRPLASPEAVDRALARARRAALSWADSPVEERVALCEAAVSVIEARAAEVAADITRTMGKPRSQALKEVQTMAARARHMMAIAAECLADVVLPGKAGFERRIEQVPLGVVFNMPAWNYPLLTCVNALWPAVLAGNSVLLKHSSRTALAGEHFAGAFAEAGAPDGLVTAIHCDHATAARIASDPRVGHVAFTGSVAGGHAVYRAVAAGFADAGLELGGKDAAYVADDADPQATAAALVDGACYNAGQSCCAVERVYVHRARYADFLEAARAEMAGLTMGDPSGDVYLGPMAQPGAPAFLERQVAAAVAGGARLCAGGHPTSDAGRGRFFEPTLLADATQDMAVMRVETFGPVLPVMAVDSDDQAVALINDSDLGLTASLWTRDRDRAARLARRLEVGTVYLDQCDTLDPALPWTGVKDSGKGSTLGAAGFAHLVRPRAINFKLGR